MTKRGCMKRSQKTNSENLEERFDAGESVLDYFDARAITVRVNVDFPAWMVKALNKESSRRGVARQALVKMWIADHIDTLKSARRTGERSRRRNRG